MKSIFIVGVLPSTDRAVALVALKPWFSYSELS